MLIFLTKIIFCRKVADYQGGEKKPAILSHIAGFIFSYLHLLMFKMSNTSKYH